MEHEFNFCLLSRIYSGIGRSRSLAMIFKDLGFRSITMFVDQALAKHSKYFDEVYRALEDSSLKVKVVAINTTREPDYDYLEELADSMRKITPPDVVVGIGGGSCMDLTKGVAALMTNPGSPMKYRGFDLLTTPGIPTFLIPTTAGTGSEATANASFIDRRENRKLGINGRYTNATYALLDAEWIASCPRAVTISSGMDALVHAVESYISRRANIFTRSFSREGFRLLWNNLWKLAKEGSSSDVNQNLLVGSYFAATAMSNASAGLASAFSYPIGVHYGVPHGIGSGIFLASTVNWYVANGIYDFSDLLDLVDFRHDLTAKEKSEIFVDQLRNLQNALGVPRHLEQWGISNDQRGRVFELMAELKPAFSQARVPFSYETDLGQILDQHIS